MNSNKLDEKVMFGNELAKLGARRSEMLVKLGMSDETFEHYMSMKPILRRFKRKCIKAAEELAEERKHKPIELCEEGVYALRNAIIASAVKDLRAYISKIYAYDNKFLEMMYENTPTTFKEYDRVYMQYKDYMSETVSFKSWKFTRQMRLDDLKRRRERLIEWFYSTEYTSMTDIDPDYIVTKVEDEERKLHEAEIEKLNKKYSAADSESISS